MRAMCPKLSRGEVAAYAAPFPDERFPAGARRFPTLVPILPDDPAIPDNRRAWQALGRFRSPFLTAFTDSDPVTRGHARALPARRSPARRGSRTRRSAARATSCRRTRAKSSRGSRSTSSRARRTPERARVPILPPPDNDYRGSRIAIWFLWLQIAVNAFRGWVHVFWADSGAGRIAGHRSRAPTARPW